MSKKIILALIPCICALMLGIVSGVDEFPFPDCNDYINLSYSLSNNFSFCHASIPPAWRTPGYPLSIMLFSWMDGYSFLAANLLFMFGIGFFTISIAEKWNVKPLWLISLLLTFSPGLITLVSVPLSEIAFTFFLIAAVYAIIIDRNNISGICLSFATLCRPIGMFIFLLFLGWLIRKKKKLVIVLLFVVLANLLPACWTARNYLKYDHSVYTTLGGYNLLYYKVGSYLSWKTGTPLPEIKKQLNASLQNIDNPFERSRLAGQLGRKLLLKNFLGFCLWSPRNLVYFFMPDINPLLERMKIISGNRGTYDILRRKGSWAAFNYYFCGNYFAMAIALVYTFFYIIISVLMLLGIGNFWQKKKYVEILVFICLAFYFMILPLGNLDWRFRMPIVPLSFIFVTAGWDFVRNR